MSVCRFCGAENEPWMKICQECGNPIVDPNGDSNTENDSEEVEEDNSSKPRKNSSNMDLKMIILVLSVVLVGLLIYTLVTL